MAEADSLTELKIAPRQMQNEPIPTNLLKTTRSEDRQTDRVLLRLPPKIGLFDHDVYEL